MSLFLQVIFLKYRMELSDLVRMMLHMENSNALPVAFAHLAHTLVY